VGEKDAYYPNAFEQYITEIWIYGWKDSNNDV